MAASPPGPLDAIYASRAFRRSRNLDKLVRNVMLDCTLLRWSSYNGRCDQVIAAIEIERTQAQDTDG